LMLGVKMGGMVSCLNCLLFQQHFLL